MWYVEFHPADRRTIREVAQRRQDSNVGRSQGANLDGVSNGLREHQIGVAGEWVVVRQFGWYGRWNDFSNTEDGRHAGDVNGYEIRSTMHPQGGLLLRPKDVKHKATSQVFILVRLSSEGGRLMGWYRLEAGAVDKWWRTGIRSPAWIVPAKVLNPMDTLPETPA